MTQQPDVLTALLGREAMVPDIRLMGACTQGKAVLVTGAGGSIGSELCRQLVVLAPESLILFERSESALYELENELRDIASTHDCAGRLNIVPVLGSIRNAALVEKTILRHRIDTIFHAAAYKQVPMLEHNVAAGIQNNIFGTLVMARAARKLGVANFVLISTDKAVRPVSVMGATKRVAELILQAFNELGSRTRFSMVRFGNVLGSSGSVIPLFTKQILAGGPVTVTHPEVTRFFMTVQEAAQLVIQAAALARGGDVFVLDMHQPVRIADLARKLVHLLGYHVCTCLNGGSCSCDDGISIRFTGLRAGEKIHEELLIGNTVFGTAHPKVMRAVETYLKWPELESVLMRLDKASRAMDLALARATLAEVIEGFDSRISVAEEKAGEPKIPPKLAEQESIRLAVNNP